MSKEQFEVIMGLMVIIASGVSSWVGVKTAIARIMERLDNQRNDIDELTKRINRLEDVYFRRNIR